MLKCDCQPFLLSLCSDLKQKRCRIKVNKPLLCFYQQFTEWLLSSNIPFLTIQKLKLLFIFEELPQSGDTPRASHLTGVQTNH